MEDHLICRTCLSDTNELFELFGETGMELNLPSKMSDHLRIPVEQTGEQTMMCSKCISVLNEFHDLYVLAQEVQSHFQNLSIETEQKIVLHDPDTIVTEDVEGEYVEIGTEYVEQEDEPIEEVIIEETVDEEYVPNEEEFDGSGGEEEEEYEDEGLDEEVIGDTTPKSRGVRTGRKQSSANAAERIEQENELIRQTLNLKCTECAHVSLTYEEYFLHCREVHKQNGILTCCGKQLERRRKVLDHAKLHVNPSEFACNVCQKQFSSKYYLTHHMSVHIPEELCEFHCEKCSKRFSTRTRLHNHLKVHNTYDFKCHICDKAFNQKATLYQHIKMVHEQTYSHICEVCAKAFKTREAFISHQANHMETPPPRVTCHICGKKMKNRDTLNQHILRHKHENDRYPCEICQREFNCKKRLNQHRKYVHTAAKLKCDYCEKTFKRPICLKEHMASHTGTLLYTCAYCPRQFNSNANKYSHQKAQHPVEWRTDKLKKENE